jgi:hypothetical protein
MSENKNNVEEPLQKMVYPKRFIDRDDLKTIIVSAEDFSRRGHTHIPNWMSAIFIISQVLFIGFMIYFARLVLKSQQQQSEVLSVIQYMMISFVVVTTYSLFIVGRLKKILTATEFMSLFLSKSLESYSSCYCIINKAGKIIFYNDSFSRSFMASDEVEKKSYPDLLDKTIFEDKYIDKIRESIEEVKENSFSLVSSTNNSQTMRNVRIVPLSRPDGIFVMKVITVEIVKGKTKQA